MSQELPPLTVQILASRIIQQHDWPHAAVAMPYWRWYWNPEPGSQIVYANRMVAVGPDSVVLIAPETVYQTRFRGGPRAHIFNHFTLAGLSWLPRPGIVGVAVDDSLAGQLAALRDVIDGDAGSEQLMAVGLCTRLLLDWPERLRHRPALGPRIEGAVAFLREEDHRTVSNAELATRAGMHVNALIRTFKRSTGLSPQAWHHRLRIERAGIELAGGGTIDAIADRYGYCDRHHFSRVFTRIRGIAPAAYRRAAREGTIGP